MEQLPETLIGAGFLIIKSVCSDYDYLTVTMVFICNHIFKFLPLTFTFSTVSILKTFLLLDFKCYKDHECSYMYVHAAIVGVMLHGVGSMLLVDSSLVQLFVSSRLSVLTTYVYRCHTSLTVMPLSVFV